MNNLFSPFIQLSLIFYENSSNLGISHLKKINTLLYNTKQINLNLFKTEIINESINKTTINFAEIFKNQFDNKKSQANLNLLEWVDELSGMQRENTDLLKTYISESNTILGELINENIKNIKNTKNK